MSRQGPASIGAVVAICTIVLVLPARQWTRAQPSAPASTSTKPHPAVDETTDASCPSCHGSVASGAVVHGPVAGGSCSACHVFSGSGTALQVALAEGAEASETRGLCTSCHEDIKAALSAAHVHGPAAAGDCVSCHAPHAAAAAKLLKEPGGAGCVTCHTEVEQALARKVPHNPAAVECALCHDPHGSAENRQLRKGVNALCQACHLVPGDGTRDGTSLFGRPVPAATRALLAPDRVIELDAGRKRGHPMVGHPVAGSTTVDDRSEPLTCVSCHDPHGADLPSLQKGGPDPSRACVRCHK